MSEDINNYQLKIPGQSNDDNGQIDTSDHTDKHSEIVDQPGNDQRFVALDNSNASDHSIYDKLNSPRYNPVAAKIAEEAKIGTLDDGVDITDPNYNEAKTEAIEREIAHQ